MRLRYLAHKKESSAFNHNLKDRLLSILFSFLLLLPILLLLLNLVIFIRLLDYVILLIGLVVYLMMVLSDIFYYKYLTLTQKLPYKSIIYFHLLIYGLIVVLLIGLLFLLKGFLL